MAKDLTAILPNGESFHFWEQDCPYSRTLYVDGRSPAASDENDGSEARPFKTIQRAADLAEPGTRVLIHGGVYRECVSPARGGDGPDSMIAYEAFGDGPVVIRASEEIHDFSPSTGWRIGMRMKKEDLEGMRIYAHRLSPDMFRGYNPFCAVNILHDRLFIEYDKTDMTPYLNRRGCVFCDGKPLRQVALYHQLAQSDSTYWVEHNGQTVHFRLPQDADPRDHLIEVTVREQCFAPEEPFLSYIKLKGLICEHAATGAPVPQRGAISAHRGHHWVIEDCEVNWSNAVAIDIGNECWHHVEYPDQIIGYTVIRRCHIRDAGVCGIAGLNAHEVLIEDNIIEGTGWQKMELSWEAGAIKLHNSLNALFRRNLFLNTLRADHLWLDCNNENNRITAYLFLNGIQQREAIFIECTREGINLIDNNIIWNVEGRFDPAKIQREPGSSGWYKLRENDTVNGYAIYGEGTDRLHISHNLIGKCRYGGYFAKPVSFRMGGSDRGGTSRDARIFNNIFYECGESAITFPTADNEAEGNLYVRLRGGYLRVMYPEPENCLNLPAWQEFFGFDKTGRSGWFDIALDEEKGTVTASESEDAPGGYAFQTERLRFIRRTEDLPLVAPDPMVCVDYTGEKRPEGGVLPGPFASLAKPVPLRLPK